MKKMYPKPTYFKLKGNVIKSCHYNFETALHYFNS